jgi:hypothetical protein
VLFIIDGTLQSEDQRMPSTEAIEEGRSNLGVSAFKDEESASLYSELDFPWIKWHLLMNVYRNSSISKA